MRIGKLKIIAVLLAVIFTVILPVYAYMYTTSKQMPTGITILAANPEIVIYWDSNCTERVTFIDFGEVVQPNYKNYTLTKRLYIKNEGAVNIVIYWNSTLNSVTNNITDKWSRQTFPSLPNWNESLIMSDVYWITDYSIVLLPEYIPVGTYNWTLTVWGVY